MAVWRISRRRKLNRGSDEITVEECHRVVESRDRRLRTYVFPRRRCQSPLAIRLQIGFSMRVLGFKQKVVAAGMLLMGIWAAGCGSNNNNDLTNPPFFSSTAGAGATTGGTTGAGGGATTTTTTTTTGTTGGTTTAGVLSSGQTSTPITTGATTAGATIGGATTGGGMTTGGTGVFPVFPMTTGDATTSGPVTTVTTTGGATTLGVPTSTTTTGNATTSGPGAPTGSVGSSDTSGSTTSGPSTTGGTTTPSVTTYVGYYARTPVNPGPPLPRFLSFTVDPNGFLTGTAGNNHVEGFVNTTGASAGSINFHVRVSINGGFVDTTTFTGTVVNGVGNGTWSGTDTLNPQDPQMFGPWNVFVAPNQSR